MELPVQNVWCNRMDLAQTRIRRQLAPPGPGFQGVLMHQPLDATQTAGHAFSQHVFPNPPCAIEPAPAKAGVRSLSRKLRRTRSSTASFSRVLLAGLRLSQSWKPGFETSSALQSHATPLPGSRCKATTRGAKLSGASRRMRTSYRIPREVGCGLF